MMRRSLVTILSPLAWAGVLLGAASGGFALSSSEVLVIYNSASADGAQIASYYAQAYPGVQVLSLQNVPTTEQIPWDVYLNDIRPQVLSALSDSIDCIVTTRGLPLRIDNPPTTPLPGWKRFSSLESELTRVDTIDSRTAMGDQGFFNPLIANPYAGQDGPFDHDSYGTRLVTRLDGFSAADVMAGIDRARRAVIGRPGIQFVVDDHPDRTDNMEKLRDNVLVPRGVEHIYDGTDAFVRQASGPVLGYVSHGVHGGVSERYIRDPSYGLAFPFAPGAVFHTWESFNAYTFQGSNDVPSPMWQGLVAQWIARGGSAGVGNVQEPTANPFNVTNEDLLFEKLLDGFTWAEAVWYATPQLSYVNTAVGDPLMAWRQWLPGDYDLDHDVDMFDLAAVKVAYGKAAGEDGYDFWADMDADGDVDMFDLAEVKFCYTGSGGGGLVPEPAVLSLLALGAAALLRRRGR